MAGILDRLKGIFRSDSAADTSTPGADSPAKSLSTQLESPDAIRTAAFERDLQEKAVGARSIADLLDVQVPSAAGRHLNKRTLLAAYHQVPPFFAAVNAVTKRVASTPWHIKRGDEVITDHPALDLLKQPNNLMTGTQWRKLLTAYLLVVGEGQSIVSERAERGQDDPRYALLPFPPHSIRRRTRRNGNWFWHVNHGQFRENVDADAMLWMRDLDLEDPYGRGRGIGEVLIDELEITEFSARHQKSELANRGVPAFIAYVAGGGKATTDRMSEKWKREMRGPDQAGKGMFLGGEEQSTVQIKQMQRSLDDMSFHELREFSHKLIERTIGVSPEILGRIDDSNRATSEHAQKIFADQVQRPILEQEKDVFDKFIIPLFDTSGDLEFGFKDPSPKQRAFQLQVLKARPDAFTVNEVRELADKDPREGGDVYLRDTRRYQQIPAGPTTSESRGIDDTGVVTRDVAEREARDADNIIDVDFHISTKVGETEADAIADAITTAPLRDVMADEYERQAIRWFVLRRNEADDIVDGRGWHTAIRKQEDDDDDNGDGDRITLADATRNEVFMRAMEAEKRRFVAEKVVGINNTTKEQIQDIVLEGLRQGKNPRRLVREIKGLHLEQIIPKRSTVIARTEMLRGSNWASQKAMEDAPEVTHKQWIASIDGSTRKTHRDNLRNMVVRVQDPFEAISAYDGAQISAMHPGGFGVPHEDIQCRCTLAQLTEALATMLGRLSEAEMTKVWKNFDQELLRSEQAFERVTRLAFRAQWQDEIAPAIRSVFDIDPDDIDINSESTA